MNKEDKLKALDAALTQIEKAYGKGSVMKLGDSGANMNIETIPTGSLSRFSPMIWTIYTRLSGTARKMEVPIGTKQRCQQKN